MVIIRPTRNVVLQMSIVMDRAPNNKLSLQICLFDLNVVNSAWTALADT